MELPFVWGSWNVLCWSCVCVYCVYVFFFTSICESFLLIDPVCPVLCTEFIVDNLYYKLVCLNRRREWKKKTKRKNFFALSPVWAFNGTLDIRARKLMLTLLALLFGWRELKLLFFTIIHFWWIRTNAGLSLCAFFERILVHSLTFHKVWVGYPVSTDPDAQDKTYKKYEQISLSLARCTQNYKHISFIAWHGMAMACGKLKLPWQILTKMRSTFSRHKHMDVAYFYYFILFNHKFLQIRAESNEFFYDKIGPPITYNHNKFQLFKFICARVTTAITMIYSK